MQVFQLSALQIFSENELEYLLCGRRESWLVSWHWCYTKTTCLLNFVLIYPVSQCQQMFCNSYILSPIEIVETGCFSHAAGVTTRPPEIWSWLYCDESSYTECKSLLLSWFVNLVFVCLYSIWKVKRGIVEVSHSKRFNFRCWISWVNSHLMNNEHFCGLLLEHHTFHLVDLQRWLQSLQ